MRLDLRVLTAKAGYDVQVVVNPELAVDAFARGLADAIGSGGTGFLPLYQGRELLDPSRSIGSLGLVRGDLIGLGAPVPPEGGGLHVLRVVGGALAGRRYALPEGPATVGRATDCSVVLDDIRASAVHLRLTPSPTGLVVADSGSTNGTSYDGFALEQPRVWERGDTVRVGGSVLEIDEPRSDPARLERTTAGALLYSRPPRIRNEPLAPGFSVPPAPAEKPKARLPLSLILVPLVLSGVMLLIPTIPKTFLLFSLMSPLMAVGAYAGDANPIGRGRARKAYARAAAEAAVGMEFALRREAAQRRLLDPDPGLLSTIAVGRSRRLWERRPVDADFLLLRLGLADRPAILGPEGGPLPPGVDLRVRQVPVTVNLRDAGVLGLVGPRQSTVPLARALLQGLAVQHSPRDLRLVVLGTSVTAPDWDPVKWLPHTVVRDGGRVQETWAAFDEARTSARVIDLVRLVHQRLAVAEASGVRGLLRGSDGPPVLPAFVIVLDGAYRPSALPGLSTLLAEGPRVGMHTICLGATEEALPEDCGAVVRTSTADGLLVSVQLPDSTVVREVLADGVPRDVLDVACRALSPVQDVRASGGAAGLPGAARLLDLIGMPLPDAEQVALRWEASPRSTTVVLGVGEGGPLEVDLRRDGPHGLVAGTTGAGKSELLQTLIAGLALSNRPDRMTFLLIDYKGGSAFKDCARLPHTVGLVTDLDGHLVERALISLTAELKRREALFAAAGVKDLDGYWSTSLGSQRPLARLLLVVDEFASLVEEVPDFVKGLVGVGMRGRSLGVHMVLATQRPAGVVTQDIRANTNLRICLRVSGVTDSLDVVDSPEAAKISKLTPGRAYLRTGHSDLNAFQAARVGGRVPDSGSPVGEALVVNGLFATHLDPDEDVLVGLANEEDDGETDLTRLVDAVRSAAEQVGIAGVERPWQPPLPELVTLAELESQATGLGVPLGLQDVPQQQAYAARSWWPPRDGHLLVVGGPQSGRTTLIRSLAVGLARGLEVDQAHLYILDGGNRALKHLEELPHVGAVVDVSEQERVRRLLSFLSGEVRARQRLLAEAGVSDLEELRALTPLTTPARLYVLVDKYDAFLAAHGDLDGGRLVEEVERLLREGLQSGVCFALTSDRTGVSGRLQSATASKLLLRMADRDDFSRFGIPAKKVPGSLPAGRGIWADGTVETQLAVVGSDPSGVGQRAAVSAEAARAMARAQSVPVARRPRRVDALPTAVSLSRLRAESGVSWEHEGDPALLGIGGDELVSLAVTLDQANPFFVVSGPPGSGRSSALVTLCAGLVGGPGFGTVVLAPRLSPLRALQLPGLTVLADDRIMVEELVHLGVEDMPGVLVLDDAELLFDAPVSGLLDNLVRRARDTGVRVLVAGSPDTLATSYKPWVQDLRKSRSGLLLAPSTPMDGQVFGMNLPRSLISDPLPGRGLLVDRGAMTALQVAMLR